MTTPTQPAEGLPELPLPNCRGAGWNPLYDADQMRAYAREAIAAARRQGGVTGFRLTMRSGVHPMNDCEYGIFSRRDQADFIGRTLMEIDADSEPEWTGFDVQEVAAAPSAPVGVEGPLSVFSAGEWRYSETGQTFSAKDLDEAAFVVYRDHLAQQPAAVDAYKVFHAVSAYVSPADRSHFRKALEQALAQQPAPPAEAAPFVVKHYTGDEGPTIKGNGFDGLRLGEDREEAEEFVRWINARLAQQPAAVDGAMANLRDAILRNDGLTRKNTLAAFRAVENALATQRQEPKP